MTRRRRFFGVIAVYLCALIAVWIVDVTVNLDHARKAVLGTLVPAPMKDYVGLLIADTQIAVVLTCLAWLIGSIIHGIRRRSDATTESVAFLGAALGGLALLGHWVFARNSDPSAVTRPLVIAVAVGCVLWIAIRFRAGKTRRVVWGMGDILQFTVFPALIVGLGDQALVSALGGRWLEAALAGLALALLLGVVLAIPRVRAALGRTLLRWFPVWATAGLVLYSAVGAASYGASRDIHDARPGDRRPSIFLIVLDTVGADHLQTYGYERETMPNLDQWSRGVLVFSRATASAGWTSPSHASMFSGLPVSRHGIHSSRHRFYTEGFEGIPWLAGRLAEEGYYRLAVAANHYALPYDLREGFTQVLTPHRIEWHISNLGAAADYFSPLLRWVNEPMRWRLPYLDAERIVDVVKRAVPGGDGPVFCFVNFMDAHSPYNPPARDLDDFEQGKKRLFSRYYTHRRLTRRWRSLPEGKSVVLNALYDAELHGLDSQLARLLDWIDERYGDDTIVVVTSDHGEELGDDGRVGHEYGLSQALLHVPLLVRSPDLPPGRVDDLVNIRYLYDFIDVAAGGEPAGLELLVGGDEYGNVAERYPSGYNKSLGKGYDRPWISMFEGRYKGVGPSWEGFELYDIEARGFSADARMSDLQAEQRLSERIDVYWVENEDRREEQIDSLTKEQRDRLRSLGYID
jgi:arylsulfatase A-like enzyme